MLALLTGVRKYDQVSDELRFEVAGVDREGVAFTAAMSLERAQKIAQHLDGRSLTALCRAIIACEPGQYEGLLHTEFKTSLVSYERSANQDSNPATDRSDRPR